jgi:hypothetical protein
MNIIDEQLQLIILFIFPRGDNLIISFLNLPNLNQEGCWGHFLNFSLSNAQLFGISISNFN